MNAASPRLEIRRLRKSFAETEVLDDISLAVGAHEFVALLGPSGAGKSTIFNLLLGETEPDRGEMLLDGRRLANHGGSFAFMPQRDALMPWRRVIDNATVGLEISGMRRRAARERVRPLLAEFGLAGFESHYPAQLSGGMRQRVALLRTAVLERDLLLLDEPFSALDALTRTSMQQWLQATWQAHAWTAMLVTHDVREAIFLSDRIYLLSPRPARIVLEVEVPLPRPRTLSHLLTPTANAIEAEILACLLKPDFSQGVCHA